jgi:glycosyltransferase involved in cell wall biosynthesis
MSRHILAIDFRDPEHPDAGGSELHLESILLEALRRGYQVTWLVSGFPGAAPEKDYRGIRLIRRGNWWNFNLLVPCLLRSALIRPSPDLIIENVNKVPFLAPCFTRVPVSVVVPHLFGTTAFLETVPPIALYVCTLEALIPRIYRRSKFLAISASTRDDLVHRGIREESISVVPCGIDLGVYRLGNEGKARNPTILYVGRLRRYKGLDWMIRAFPRVRASFPDAIFQILGRGPHQTTLQRLAANLSLANAVQFLGYLPQQEKVRLLQAAWILVQPSRKEGWGLSVQEAGACGTAVVAADSPGLCDSVKAGETGLLVPNGDEERLANSLVQLIGDPERRNQLARAGREWASRFRVEEASRISLDVLLAPLGPGL